MDTTKELLTVSEVADRFRVSEETVRRWLRSGQLEGIRLARRSGWRVHPDAIDRMVEAMRTLGKLAA
jgi:excisionase family DNA binding protein